MYANNGFQTDNYGSMPDAGPLDMMSAKGASAAFLRGPRRRLNAVPLFIALFGPWALFAFVFAAMTFTVHYENPFLAYLVVALGFLAVLGAGVAAFQARRRKLARDPGHEPSWLMFMFLTMLVAWIAAFVAGDVNFYDNMQPYFDLKNLNVYPDVDPAVMRGQMIMDAGRIEFTQNARLDLTRSIGFKNVDVYCVAPVSKAKNATLTNLETLSNYDFWAVGVNCCSGNDPDFHCGQFNSAGAHGGLRLTRDDQRPFYRLAVQQAEAAYNIKAVHPLFFVWMKDPQGATEAMWVQGVKAYMIGLFTHFSVQMFLVASATMVFARLGHL